MVLKENISFLFTPCRSIFPYQVANLLCNLQYYSAKNVRGMYHESLASKDDILRISIRIPGVPSFVEEAPIVV